MDSKLAAIEVTGTIDEHSQLRLDCDLPIPGPMRVRVLVLYPADDEWNEAEWLHAASSDPAFAFLSEPREDIYMLSDGRAFNDKEGAPVHVSHHGTELPRPHSRALAPPAA